MFTPQQQIAVTKMQEFINSDKRFFLFSGFAGTGKTFTITRFILQLAGLKRVFLAAATNKAVAVLERMAEETSISVNTGTIHSLLGLALQQKQDEQILVQRSDPRLYEYDVVVIDECSMLGAAICRHIRNAAETTSTKIIFMGDSAQLPPVHEGRSPAFGVPEQVELTDIVRQQEESPIITLSAAIRESMQTKERIYVQKYLKDSSCVFLKKGRSFHEWFPEAFRSERYAEDPDSFRVVAWTNKNVIQINQKIRGILLGPKSVSQPFFAGERAVTAGAVHKSENELAINTDVEGDVVECSKVVHPWFKDEIFSVWQIVFRPDTRWGNVTLFIPDETDKPRISALLSTYAKEARARQRPWGDFWKLKHGMADLRPCHAITVHRAQGSTYRSVFIDSENILLNNNRMEALQCLYVAVTRASKNIILNSEII